MIKPEQIPDEVVEAMARPVTYPSGASVKYINALHLAAALAAWPGTEINQRICSRGTEYIILPLQETQNAE